TPGATRSAGAAVGGTPSQTQGSAGQAPPQHSAPAGQAPSTTAGPSTGGTATGGSSGTPGGGTGSGGGGSTAPGPPGAGGRPPGLTYGRQTTAKGSAHQMVRAPLRRTARVLPRSPAFSCARCRQRLSARSSLAASVRSFAVSMARQYAPCGSG